MLMHITHLVNEKLAANYYLRRTAPTYHPYYIRLYIGILYYIQILRARHAASLLTSEEYEFLIKFLRTYPLPSLIVPGPLLSYFKSLCASQPELPNYELIVPAFPPTHGPDAAKDLIPDDVLNFLVPNIPGIFALITAMNDKVANSTENYPPEGWHPVTGEPSTADEQFANHAFVHHSEWTNLEAYYLQTPGIEYPCESDSPTNKPFATHYKSFSFPLIRADADLSSLPAFLNMSTSINWFSRILDVVAQVAPYISENGSLADCPPIGLPANHVIVDLFYSNPVPGKPTRPADHNTLPPFGYSLRSSDRTITTAMQYTAAASQSNVSMPRNHNFYSQANDARLRTGPYWTVTPVYTSHQDDNNYLGLRTQVYSFMKEKASTPKPTN
jgi:hypothetical protein